MHLLAEILPSVGRLRVVEEKRPLTVPRGMGYPGTSLLGHEILRTANTSATRRGQRASEFRKQWLKS